MTKKLTSAKNFLQVVFVAATVLCAFNLLSSPVFAANDQTNGTNPSSLAQDAECTGTSTSCVCPKDASGNGCSDPAITQCPNKNDCNLVDKYVNPLVKLMAALASLAVVIGIIVGGIQYSASGGDPQKVATAKKHIRNSVIALITFIFLYALLEFLIPGGGITG